MKSKIFIQLLLFITILIISTIFYKVYFGDKTIQIDNKNFEERKKLVINNNNLIHDIQYIAKTEDGKNYIIKAKLGEINPNKPDLILMKKVTAIINNKDSTPTTITADNALYDRLDFNTKFYDNVLAIYDEHIIKADKINFNFQNEIATISKNIVYKNLNTKLLADKIDINLTTKDLKISMKNKFNKVKIMSLN
jgi:hypothetical protein